MEKGFVLDGGKTRVVKVTRVHETSLGEEVFRLGVGFKNLGALPATLGDRVLNILNVVFSSELIKFTFHKEIKEIASRGIVTHPAIQINGPEQWVRVRTSWIWEAY